MPEMGNALVVFVGAGLGGVLRHIVNAQAARALGAGFPWGIAIINVTGSFAMGLLAAWLALRAGAAWTSDARLFAATGVLGGYTTFSAFSLDFALLWERGETLAAAGYVLGSVGLSLVAVFAGLALVRALA